MSPVTYKKPANQTKNKAKQQKKVPRAEIVKISHKNPDFLLFLKTQKMWHHKTHIATWPKSAMAEQVLPFPSLDLPCSLVRQSPPSFWLIYYPSDSE